jgi:hypothetical protein
MKKPTPGDRGCDVQVVYALRRNAKLAKKALEQAGFLNKNFRMTAVVGDDLPANLRDCIAIPVVKEMDTYQDGPWSEFIVDSGLQVCPYSTSVLGNHRPVAGTANNGYTDLTVVQQAILGTIQSLVTSSNESKASSSYSSDQLVERIQALTNMECPKKLEVLGDDRTLVLPPLAFASDEFQALICSGSTNDDSKCMEELWIQLARRHDSSRIARRGTVDRESRIRESGHRLIWPISGIPDETGTVPYQDAFMCYALFFFSASSVLTAKDLVHQDGLESQNKVSNNLLI